MFHDLKQKIPEMFHTHKNNISLKCFAQISLHVSEHFSFAMIIHPPDRCSISRGWLNSMIITQVHLVLGTNKGHSKMCRFVTQCHRWVKFWGSVQLACWLQECPMELLTDNCVYFFTIVHLQCCFRIWQYIQPASQPQTPCNHASPGPPHPTSPAGAPEEYFCL